MLVDLVMLSAVGSFGGSILRGNHPLLAVLFSLAFSQVSMAAVWAGLGNTSLPWRLAGLVGIVTVWSVALTREAADAVDLYVSDYWSLLLLGDALFILLILLVVRTRGGRLENCLKTNAKPEKFRWQFSLGHLFAWLTATAVALGLLQYTIDYDSLMAGQNWHGVLVMGLCNAVVSLLTLWLALGGKRLLSRVVVLCLALGGVFSLPFLYDSAAAYILIFWAVLWILQIVWLAAWLFVLRTAGIRFVWRDRGR